MRIAFHFPIPRPPVPELDGAVQEALWLRERFGGSLEFLYPARSFHRFLPPQLYGVRDRRRLEELDAGVDLHHLFSPRLVGYPWLARLEKPLVYSLTTSLGGASPGAATPGTDEAGPERPSGNQPSGNQPSGGRPRGHRAGDDRPSGDAPRTGSPAPASSRQGASKWLERRFEPPAGLARRWTVADPADRQRLVDRGYDPVDAVLPGVDLTRFTTVDPPTGGDLVLLAGSAPWSRRQFRTKGVELLLDAVETTPDLRLVLLWRQVLADEIVRQVDRRGLGDRVEVIQETADVDQVLARVHAAVVLAATPRLVKSFPHSLLEALAAGRPVLVSAGLGIADVVRREGCGVVVEELTMEHLMGAIDRLRQDYRDLQCQAADFDSERFSRSRFLARWEHIYDEVLAG